LGGDPENFGATGMCRRFLGPQGLCRLLRPQGYRVQEVRDRTDEQLLRAGGDPESASLEQVAVLAANAIALKNGRCQEYASVAFIYLRYHLMCPYPLDLAGYRSPGDHAFVIVGRRHDSDGANPRTWGPQAVVCDPWADSVVDAGDYWIEMHAFPDRIYAPEIYFRTEGTGGKGRSLQPPSRSHPHPSDPREWPYARPGVRS